MTTHPRPLRPYGLALGCVALSSLVAALVEPRAEHADLAMIQLLGVVVLSSQFSVRVSMVATVVSIALFDFLFVTPRYEFAWTDAENIFTFVAMLVVAFMISSLTERLRNEEQLARTAAFRAETMYELNVKLTSTHEAKQLAAITAHHLEKLFNARSLLLLGAPDAWPAQGRDARDLELAERAWTLREFLRNDSTGAASVWLPLHGLHGPLGVIGLHLAQAFDRDSVQGALLSACANQFATAAERVQLANAVLRTELEAETERLRSSLLSAVSHDLKTPLTTIIAAGSALLTQGARIEPRVAQELASTIVGEGERLSRLIQNLMSITRLESPAIELRRAPEDVEEIVSAAVERFSARVKSVALQVTLDSDLPLVFVEPLLVEQVFTNLLENAARYAGPNATIAIHGSVWEGVVTLQVSDDGPGIREDQRSKVFEKFYRGAHADKSDGGVGLGLAICRAIVRAHGGRIHALANPRGGALIEFTLPRAPLSATAEHAGAGSVAS